MEQLYREHHSWLQGWLRRRLSCSALAADLAHDTFIRLLGREQDELATVREPRAWLSTIAHGLVVSHWRRRDLENAWLASLALQPENVMPSVEERHLVLEALLQVDQMLNGLPSKVRQAFLLAQLDGLTYRQIAQRLAVSERSVKNYMARAMLACLQLDIQ